MIIIMSNNKILTYLFLGFVAVMYIEMELNGKTDVRICKAYNVENIMQNKEEENKRKKKKKEQN